MFQSLFFKPIVIRFNRIRVDRRSGKSTSSSRSNPKINAKVDKVLQDDIVFLGTVKATISNALVHSKIRKLQEHVPTLGQHEVDWYQQNSPLRSG